MIKRWLKLLGPDASSILQNAKIIAEIIAIALAGFWALFTFPDFKKVANHLAAVKARHELEKKIKSDVKIQLRHLGPVGHGKYAYDIVYSYDITNTSADDVKIAVASLEWYTGQLAKPELQSFRANIPTEEGPIKWESHGIAVHYQLLFKETETNKQFETFVTEGYPGKSTPSREVVVLKDAREGAGSYYPDEVRSEFQTIHVEETPDAWVGFVLLLGVIDDHEETEQYHDYQFVHLAVPSISSEERPGPPAK
ncbi:MAG TPA: hypothetical protein VHB47_14335 [Thermoanaerobaculia bacterium]|jgi:hypothetical protein|nr:hypothetical protein [Thermoanaerobaculia bacterium]